MLDAVHADGMGAGPESWRYHSTLPNVKPGVHTSLTSPTLNPLLGAPALNILSLSLASAGAL